MSLRRKLFYGFTLAVVATLLLLPQTGWLARIQLAPWTLLSLGESLLGKPGANTAPVPVGKTAADTFDLRYADALMRSGDAAIARLDTLRRDYPESAPVVAALLRYLCLQSASLGRAEEELLSPPQWRARSGVRTYKPFAHGARVVELATIGERLEPQNGFYPTMAALGHFALHEDDKAVAAWTRAGNAPVWNDYTNHEVPAKWKLIQARYGLSETGSLSRMATSAAILLPHYATIRATGRMATVTAMQAEIAGNTERGFAIRRATRQVGEGMQQQGGTFLGNLLGTAVAVMAAKRVNGAEVEERPKGDNSHPAVERWVQAKQAEYAAHLRGTGHADEAAAYLSVMARGRAQKAIWNTGNDKTYVGFGEKTLQLIIAWLVSTLLLAGAVFALAFAGIFALVYKFSPRLQRNEVLQSSARWGVCMGIFVPVIAVGAMAVGQTADAYGYGLIALGIVVVMVSAILFRLTLKDIGHGVLVAGATFLSACGIGGLAVAAGATFATFTYIMGVMGGFNNDNNAVLWNAILPALGTAIMTALPLLMLAVFALFSKMLRIPVAAGVTRGTRSMGVPLAALLMLAWAASLFNTLHQERAAIHEMKRINEIGEIRAIAEITGQTLPR